MPPKILMMLQWKDVKLTRNLIVVQTYQDENEFDVWIFYIMFCKSSRFSKIS